MKQQITPSPAPTLPWLLQESLRISYCSLYVTYTPPRHVSSCLCQQSTVMGDTGLRVCMLYHIR